MTSVSSKLSLSQLFCYVANQTPGSAPLRRFNFVFAFDVAAKQGAGRPAGQTVPLGRRPDGDEQAAEGDGGQSAGGAAVEPGAGGEGPAGSREVQMLIRLLLRHNLNKKIKSFQTPPSLHQAARGPTGEVVGGQARAAGARGPAAAQVLPGQGEAAEGSSGSEEGWSPLCLWNSAFIFLTSNTLYTSYLVVVGSHSSCGRGQRCSCRRSKLRQHYFQFCLFCYIFPFHKWWVELLIVECDD